MMPFMKTAAENSFMWTTTNNEPTSVGLLLLELVTAMCTLIADLINCARLSALLFHAVLKALL